MARSQNRADNQDRQETPPREAEVQTENLASYNLEWSSEARAGT